MAQFDHGHERFGPFIIVRAIGRGGMGEVYIARTPWEESPVAAVKRLRPDVARIATFAERFKHEAELAVRLQHRNIVGTLDVGSVDEQLYVASELILGKDTGHVADRLRERGQGAPLAVVIRLLLDVLGGLAFVHGARQPDGEWLRLVHRDVTPGNVLVSYDGIAKIADFGLAKSALTEGSQLTQHGEILGTPHYLAPELIRGHTATSASDIYGLGAVMYRVLTGVAPHQGTTAEVLIKAMTEKPRSLGELRPDLPPWFVAFVHRMLETDHERRPFDAALLGRQLEHEARRSNLLLPHASVGRWLGALFEEERVEEVDEYDRIQEIDMEHFPAAIEGTVVLATARQQSWLEGPPAEAPRPDDSAGTEMDLSDARVRSVSETADEASPSDAYDMDDMDEEGMPTRAFHLPGDRSDPRVDTEGSGRAEPTADGEFISINTGRGASETSDGAARSGPLPGFVDDGPRSEPAARTGEVDLNGTADDAGAVEDERHTFVAHIQMNSLDATDMAKSPRRRPAVSEVDPTPQEAMNLPHGDRSEPPAVRARNGRSRHDRAPAQRRPNPESVIVGPAPTSRPVMRVTPAKPAPVVEPRRPRSAPTPVRPREVEPKPAGIRLTMVPLVVWFLVAMAIGGSLGVILTRDGSPKSIAPISRGLEVRYRSAREEMNARQVAGQGVSPQAVSLAAEAADALVLRDTDRASALITELEMLLETPSQP